MKHHSCEVNHPKTIPKKNSSGACRPKELPIEIQSALPLVTGQQVSEHLAVSRIWSFAIIFPHQRDSKRHQIPGLKAVNPWFFPWVLYPLKEIRKNQVTITTSSAPGRELPTWFCICNCATMGGGPREFPASVSSMCRSWRGGKKQHTFPIGFSWIFTVEKYGFIYIYNYPRNTVKPLSQLQHLPLRLEICEFKTIFHLSKH